MRIGGRLEQSLNHRGRCIPRGVEHGCHRIDRVQREPPLVGDVLVRPHIQEVHEGHVRVDELLQA